MGCLKSIIKMVVITLAVIGFLSIGGREFVNEKVIPVWNNFNKNFKTELENKNKTMKELTFIEFKDMLIASLTKSLTPEIKLQGDYEVSNVKGVMGYDAEIALDTKTGQKMLKVDTKNKIKLDLAKTDKDELKNELMKMAKKHKNIPIKFDKFDIIEQGKWNVAGTQQNYITIQVKDKFSDKDYRAIISTSGDENSPLFVTFGANDNFSADNALKYWK